MLVSISMGCSKQAEISPEANQKLISPAGIDQFPTPAIATSTPTVPHVPDHLIFVWFENKGYNRIVGSPSAPYINSLVAKGTLFTNTHALTHPSYPNYVRFFSGQDNHIESDECVDGKPVKANTMYNYLKAVGASFKWFSEGLPAVGSGACSAGYYREKHTPTTLFTKVPDTINQPITAMKLGDTSKYKLLPRVACVTPNMINDMHDGTVGEGDAWFKKQFSKLVDWSFKHNSVVVIYFDESDDSEDNNRIPVIAVGQHVAANLKLGTKYDHYNWTKTVCRMFGANNSWTSNLTDRSLITGCWK